MTQTSMNSQLCCLDFNISACFSIWSTNKCSGSHSAYSLPDFLTPVSTCPSNILDAIYLLTSVKTSVFYVNLKYFSINYISLRYFHCVYLLNTVALNLFILLTVCFTCNIFTSQDFIIWRLALGAPPLRYALLFFIVFTPLLPHLLLCFDTTMKNNN